MWLVLCNSNDHSALWAVTRLRARHIEPLTVLTPELLHYSFQWQHRLFRDGRSTIAFTLADGRQIEGGAIRGVLNRMCSVPIRLLQHLVEADRVYSQQEWTALHMSWLASLPVPVLNLPVIEGLCGAWRHQSEWVWLAGQAGLDAGDYVQQVASDAPPSRKAEPAVPHLRTVIAIDGRWIGEQVTDDVADACGRLGALAGTRILGVHLHPQSGTFISASPLPDLRAGGERVIDALASALRGAA